MLMVLFHPSQLPYETGATHHPYLQTLTARFGGVKWPALVTKVV